MQLACEYGIIKVQKREVRHMRDFRFIDLSDKPYLAKTRITSVFDCENDINEKVFNSENKAKYDVIVVNQCHVMYVHYYEVYFESNLETLYEDWQGIKNVAIFVRENY